jgi:hypothetical protein
MSINLQSKQCNEKEKKVKLAREVTVSQDIIYYLL